MKPDSPPASKRLAWADNFRGLAIILVVVGHVIGGLHTSGIIPDCDAFHYAYHWIYAFHMPAFFFVAGVFAPQSMRRGLSAFLREKAGVLVYPYVVWGLLHWAMSLMGRIFVNSSPDYYLPLRMLITLTNDLWFFYVIFLLMVVFGVCSWLGCGRYPFLFGSLVAFALAGAGFLEFWSPLNSAGLEAPYFAVGVVLADRVKSWPSQASPMALFLATVPTIVIMSLLVPVVKPENPGLILLRAILGISALFGLSVVLGRLQVVSFLQECGVRSLEIYVVHAIPSVGARILLLKVLGVGWPWLHITSGVFLGVVVSVAFGRLCDRLGWQGIFTWAGKRGAKKIPSGHPASVTTSAPPQLG